MEIAFIYKGQGGDEKTVKLAAGWRESGRYIEGVDIRDHRFKTFRKDRVVSYVDNAESILLTPFSPPPPRLEKASKTSGPDILFTGFPTALRVTLEAKAQEAGLNVCKSVTKNLIFLCTGPNAGPTKVAAARDKNVYILNEDEFLDFIETGEVF